MNIMLMRPREGIRKVSGEGQRRKKEPEKERGRERERGRGESEGARGCVGERESVCDAGVSRGEGPLRS